MTTRAPKGLMLFRADEDRQKYLDLLAGEVRSRGWSVRSYCLMGTHLHLLVRTPECDLQKGLKAVHERFAWHVHRRYEGHGHVFGGRFGNRLVTTPRYEVACLRYIARNPVKAGMCSIAEEWPWSAHRYLVGASTPPGWLDVAAAFTAVSVRAYRRLVAVPDAALLEDLETEAPQAWVVRAVDEHGLPVVEIARLKGLSASTVYRRLAEQRVG